MFRVVSALAIGYLAASCASVMRDAPKDAEQMYKNAVDDLEDGMYPEAISGFTDVKTKYPYTKFAALADLRIADANYERGKFSEAVDSYRTFLKFHPSHAEVPYAMLRIGESYYEQIPSDWWLLPPSYEKDQATTRMAIAAYRDLTARFPDGEEAKKARDRLQECRKHLADHEMYVAQFYFKREHYQAAVTRAETLLREYSDLGIDAEALLLAARSHVELGDKVAARAALLRISKEFANTPQAEPARRMLEDLGGSAPAGG